MHPSLAHYLIADHHRRLAEKRPMRTRAPGKPSTVAANTAAESRGQAWRLDPVAASAHGLHMTGAAAPLIGIGIHGVLRLTLDERAAVPAASQHFAAAVTTLSCNIWSQL
jgi:hypothetical protein